MTRRMWTSRFGRRRSLPASQAYAMWAETYPPWPHNPLMEIEQQVVAPMIGATSPSRALDVGTGSGRYLPLLASTGARLVIGVDSSMPMLSHKERNDHNVHRVCADGCRLPFGDASFDLVSSFLMVGDLSDLAAWVHEIARVVAPGGHVIYSDFHPSWATEGWRRTFQAANGRTFEIAHVPHAIAEHVTLLEARSFDVLAIHEPRLTQGSAMVAPVGSGRLDVPVVVVVHAVKRGRG